MRKRFHFGMRVLAAACVWLGTWPGAAAGADNGGAPNPAARRPNLLVIMADDLGWMDLRVQGNRLLETPNLDRLAAQGMRFTDAYAAAPVCTPTRAAMMTGKSPARLGITNHAPGHRPGFAPKGGTLGEAESQTYLGLGEVTIAERLREAGYATGFIGKWHLSDRKGADASGPWEPRLRPEHQGFDRNVGGCQLGGPPGFFDPYGIPNLPPRRAGEYLPDRLADECITFLRDHRERPFFLCWWDYAVHYPIQAPAALIEKYRGRPGVKDPAYAAMIEAMDAAIGRVLRELDELGLATNTLVLFTSDNGSLFGNEPLRANKGFLYEGGIRVPWLVRWPGLVASGTTNRVPVITTDIYPTLLAAAGLPARAGEAPDGESLLPVLRQTGALRRQALYFHYPNYAFHQRNRLGSALRDGDWKLIRNDDDGSLELYDLAADPGETRDLAAARPEMARTLNAQLEAWLKSSGARRPTRVNPIP
jgi:arylsulfatase A-like enzyme